MQIYYYSHAQFRYIYRREHFLRQRCSPELCLRLHHSISFHLFITGYTKFSPDACFCPINRKFCCTNVSLVDGLAHVVNESAECNFCQLVGTQDGQTIVPSRDWAVFLSSHFRRLGGIKQYHHFRFERDSRRLPRTAEEETWCLLLGDWSPSQVDKPPLVPATGLSLEKRRYLFERIREYCREDCKDAVCSDPSLLIHQPPEINLCYLLREYAHKCTIIHGLLPLSGAHSAS